MRPLLAILCLLLAGCSAPTKAQRIRSDWPTGYRSTCMDTGSALPVFRGGDILWVNTAARYKDLRLGMWVIAAPYEDSIPIGPHVIVSSEGPLFKTKGINSPTPDRWTLSPSNFIGTVKHGWRAGKKITVPDDNPRDLEAR